MTSMDQCTVPDKATQDRIFAVSNPDAQLHDRPSYSNPYWQDIRTIYGESEPDLHYLYDDRLKAWEPEKYESAWKQASLKHHNRSANFYQDFLRLYFGREVELKHIKAGIDIVVEPIPYLVFGFKG